MIFYFTATGNSLMAAKALLEEGERLVDMAAARKAGAYNYDLAEGERVGFVFPVYCYTMGDVPVDFVRNLTLNRHPSYTFTVVTCGGGIGGTAAFLGKELRKKGITLSYATDLLMPDNAVFYYDTKSDAHHADRLGKATVRLEEIKSDLSEHKEKRAKGLSSGWLRPFYHALCGTKPFYVTDKCVGCGLCARNCPDGAIEMNEGKPRWIKKRCEKCGACINRCPVRAIEHGKGTVKRGRYVNPILKGGDNE